MAGREAVEDFDERAPYNCHERPEDHGICFASELNFSSVGHRVLLERNPVLVQAVAVVGVT